MGNRALSRRGRRLPGASAPDQAPTRVATLKADRCIGGVGAAAPAPPRDGRCRLIAGDDIEAVALSNEAVGDAGSGMGEVQADPMQPGKRQLAAAQQTAVGAGR